MKCTKQCVSATLFFLLAGCAETTLSPPVAPEAIVLTKERAVELAQEEVREIASGGRTYVWNASSAVTDAFPVYLDGIEGVSYYECKVVTDGKESGYVLVNVNGSDVTVTEASEEGTTLNEYYEEATGRSREELAVYRYGFTASAAFEKDEGGITARGAESGGKKPLAAVGLGEDFDFDAYRAAVALNGGSPLTEVVETDAAVSARGMTGRGNAEVYLRTSWDASATTSTPKWTQFNVVDGNNKKRAIGCGPLAYALVFAYWQEKKGMNNLLYNGSLHGLGDGYPEALKETLSHMANALDTGNYKEQGYTLPSKMKNVTEWLAARGFRGTVEARYGGYDSKFNKIYDSLAADRPVVLLINGDGIGAMSHYVVVEHAKRVSGSNAYIRYYCNFGWGPTAFEDTKNGRTVPNSHKWVYAFNMKDPSTTADELAAARHSVYQFWDITVSK